MDNNSASRFALPSTVVILATAVMLKCGEYFTTATAWLYQQAHTIDFNELFKATVDHVFLVIICSFIAFNSRTILTFIRKYVNPTDAQIVGEWHVSRYIKKHEKIEILTEVWRIRRSLTRAAYWVRIYSETKGGWRTSGKVVYNERDRLNILLTGDDHKQQSLICFQVNIPRKDDSRILGIGVGDDSQYVLGTRVYFASLTKLPDDYIKAVIDEATTRLSQSTKIPIFQMPTNVISEVFGKYPMPPKPQIVPKHIATSLYSYLQHSKL